jgi:hypothetical protein
MSRTSSQIGTAASTLVTLALVGGLTPLQVSEVYAQTSPSMTKSPMSYFVKNTSDWNRFVSAIKKQDERRALDIGQKSGMTPDEIKSIMVEARPTLMRGSASPMFW